MSSKCRGSSLQKATLTVAIMADSSLQQSFFNVSPLTGHSHSAAQKPAHKLAQLRQPFSNSASHSLHATLHNLRSSRAGRIQTKWTLWHAAMHKDNRKQPNFEIKPQLLLTVAGMAERRLNGLNWNRPSSERLYDAFSLGQDLKRFETPPL